MQTTFTLIEEKRSQAQSSLVLKIKAVFCIQFYPLGQNTPLEIQTEYIHPRTPVKQQLANLRAVINRNLQMSDNPIIHLHIAKKC